MNVITQEQPRPAPMAGIAHATWAGADDGLVQLSVWRQTLAPGAATPPHRHDCDEVVLCQSGHGELRAEGQVQHFGPDQTLVLPRGRTHQIVSLGPTPLEIIGVFGVTPVATFLPNGEEVVLPWRT